MPEVQSIVSTFVISSFLILFYIHILFKEKMRGANLILASISVLLFGAGSLFIIWNPLNLRQLDILPIFIITIGTASGFAYAAFKFDVKKNGLSKEEIKEEHNRIIAEDSNDSQDITIEDD